MDSETVRVLLANRAFLYALAARAYAEEPDGAFLELLASEHARREAALVDSPFTESISSAFDGLAALASRPDAEVALSREYVRVFVGPTTLKALPYETALLSGRRSLFQPGVLDVREHYLKAGFLSESHRRSPDDFIGTELDFMAKLASRTLQSWERGDDARAYGDLRVSRAFLRDHVLKWIGKLAGSIEDGYGTCFYAMFTELAALVAERDDAVVLEELLGAGV